MPGGRRLLEMVENVSKESRSNRNYLDYLESRLGTQITLFLNQYLIHTSRVCHQIDLKIFQRTFLEFSTSPRGLPAIDLTINENVGVSEDGVGSKPPTEVEDKTAIFTFIGRKDIIYNI
uniref:Uncharacterized protein n=1 Tax=Steinernema glaseri TaxID=37863 RepID=A0A1I7YWS6_9BILA